MTAVLLLIVIVLSAYKRALCVGGGQSKRKSALIGSRIYYCFAVQLKMHFFRDSSVSSVLESSFTPRKLRLSGRCFLALTQKLLFLEMP